MYNIPLMTARISSVRGLPPGFAGGIGSLIQSHWRSVRSVGYRWFFFISQVYRLDSPAVIPFQTGSKLDFVQFLEERTPIGPCCKIEADKRYRINQEVFNVPSQSHYSCSGPFSATVYGTNMAKSGD